MAGAGLIALYGLGALAACAVIALASVLAAWLVALIAAAAQLLAAVGALLGTKQLQRASPPVPAGAVGSIKADLDEIKERTHR